MDELIESLDTLIENNQIEEAIKQVGNFLEDKDAMLHGKALILAEQIKGVKADHSGGVINLQQFELLEARIRRAFINLKDNLATYDFDNRQNVENAEEEANNNSKADPIDKEKEMRRRALEDLWQTTMGLLYKLQRQHLYETDEAVRDKLQIKIKDTENSLNELDTKIKALKD